jgi:hypothetical protein
MVAMVGCCGIKTRYICHLISSDLAGGVEEGGDSSGCRFYRVVDLVRSTFAIGLVLEASNGFKGSMESTSALGRWSLRTHAQRLSDCQRKGVVMRVAHQRLALAAIVVIRWFKDFDIILLYLIYFIILVNSQNRFESFQIKNTVNLCTAKKREMKATVEECGGSSCARRSRPGGLSLATANRSTHATAELHLHVTTARHLRSAPRAAHQPPPPRAHNDGISRASSREHEP